MIPIISICDIFVSLKDVVLKDRTYTITAWDTNYIYTCDICFYWHDTFAFVSDCSNNLEINAAKSKLLFAGAYVRHIH